MPISMDISHSMVHLYSVPIPVWKNRLINRLMICAQHRLLLQQDAVCPYIDVAEEYGLSGDVCPMPEAEAGVSIADDFPIFGACAIQCNTTCDGSMMGNGIMARRLEVSMASRASS